MKKNCEDDQINDQADRVCVVKNVLCVRLCAGRAAKQKRKKKQRVARIFGGAGGIRTLDRALQPYNGLANRRLQPLGHDSSEAGS